LALPDLATSRMRVAERVSHGGHNVPDADLRRRFPRSLRNFLEVFAQRVDEAVCYLHVNSRAKLVFAQKGEDRTISDQQLFNQLSEAPHHVSD
jgi:predicted ABC-type ATPase